MNKRKENPPQIYLKKMKPNYSIIIPHKDIPDLLQRCLDSIPVRDDVEVIVVDDNSDPKKVDFEHFPGLERDNTRVIFSKDGGGAGHARNVGLDHARGRWIVFADADDFFTEDFNGLLDETVDAEEDIVFFDYINVLSKKPTQQVTDRNRYKKFISAYLDGDKSESDLRIYFFVPWCKFIKRELIEHHRIRFHEVKWNNDLFFSVQAGCLAKTIAVSGKEAYVVTLREGSLTYDLCATGEELAVRLVESVKTEEWMKKNGYRTTRCLTSSYLWVYYDRNGFWKTLGFCLCSIFNWRVFKTTLVFLAKRIGKREF